MDIDPILEALRAAKGLIGTFKDYTKTQFDNHIYKVLDFALGNKALLEMIRQLVNDPEVVAATDRQGAVLGFAEQYIDATLLAEADAAGVSLTTLLQYLPLLIEIVLKFLKKA